jgi:hypothetical protein
MFKPGCRRRTDRTTVVTTDSGDRQRETGCASLVDRQVLDALLVDGRGDVCLRCLDQFDRIACDGDDRVLRSDLHRDTQFGRLSYGQTHRRYGNLLESRSFSRDLVLPLAASLSACKFHHPPEVVDRSMFVPTCFAVMFAPATTAPFGSTTVPVRSAVLAWAWPKPVEAPPATNKNSMNSLPIDVESRLETAFIWFSP